MTKSCANTCPPRCLGYGNRPIHGITSGHTTDYGVDFARVGANNVKLAGHVAFISDGASTSGRAIAEKLASEGARLVLHTDSPETTKQLSTAEWVSTLGVPTFVTTGAITRGAEVDRLFTEVLERYRQVDVLVHNTRLILPARIEDCDLTTYQSLLAINLKSAFLLTQAFARQSGCSGGRVVYVSTIHDEKPTGASFPYAVAKGALQMLAREAALDLGRRGARVNLIEMGPMLGDDVRFRSETSDLYRDYAFKVPSAELGTAQDLANMVWFLSIPESRFVNGANLRLDGGFTLHYMNHKMKRGPESAGEG